MPDLWTPPQQPQNEPEIRLLICGECKTIEEVSDFDGPPERDEELAARVAKHRTAGVPHGNAGLARVSAVVWNSPRARDEIREKISASFGSSGQTGFGAETYALMDNLREDAMECFGRHLRNPNCPDYKSDSKRLVPDTKAERKELGLSPKYDDNPRLTRYLCEYCPVHSLVQQAARKKAGLYE